MNDDKYAAYDSDGVLVVGDRATVEAETGNRAAPLAPESYDRAVAGETTIPVRVVDESKPAKP